MFGSNSYLGLTNHPEIKAARYRPLRRSMVRDVQGAASLNGTLDTHLELEKQLAAFVGKEDAIIFSTGFQVNLGVISCLLGREDYIIWDALDHASIIEGIRLSPAKSLRYKHNDMEALERRLKQCAPIASSSSSSTVSSAWRVTCATSPRSYVWRRSTTPR